MPPRMTQRQQQLAIPMTGSADNTPMNNPPSSAGWKRVMSVLWDGRRSGSVVVFAAQVRDEFFTAHVPQRVLQLHELDKEVVLRVELRHVHRALEVKREPLLNAFEAGALGQIQEQRHGEHHR